MCSDYQAGALAICCPDRLPNIATMDMVYSTTTTIVLLRNHAVVNFCSQYTRVKREALTGDCYLCSFVKDQRLSILRSEWFAILRLTALSSCDELRAIFLCLKNR